MPSTGVFVGPPAAAKARAPAHRGRRGSAGKFSHPPLQMRIDLVEGALMKSDEEFVPFRAQVPLFDFLYSVNISIVHRYIYVETPKVGCSTLKSLLIRAELDDDLKFRDLYAIHDRARSPLLNPRQVGDFSNFIRKDPFKFCFVRNPYSRLLSSYLDIIANPDPRRDKIVQRLANQSRIGSGLRADTFAFSEFVEAVIQQPVELMDAHWRMQYYQTFQESFRYDFIGRFEHFADDVRLVCDKIGIDFTRWYRREAQHATDADNRLDEFYDQRLRDLVHSKFRLDFEHFGYPA